MEYSDTKITVNEKSITFSLTKTLTGNGKIKDTDKIDLFILDCFKNNVKWKYDNKPPYFEYCGILFSINGDKLKPKSEYVDAIAVFIPEHWGELENVVNRINKHIDYKHKLAHCKKSKKYIYIEIVSWKLISFILEFLFSEFGNNKKA